MPTLRRSLCIAIVLFLVTSARAALTADNLLLVVNKNVPESQKLAEYYAQQRHVPPGRIVSLDLPTGDDISADDFDEKMVAPIREFLAANQLEHDVTCVVNFYGVPLRIPNRTSTPELRAELVSLRKQLAEATKQSEALVDSLEKIATQVDSTFKPVEAPIGQHIEPSELLPARADHAAKAIVAKLQTMPADATRTDLEAKFKKLTDVFRAPVTIAEPSTSRTTAPTTIPQTNGPLTQSDFTTALTKLAMHRGDPVARRAFRDLVREHGGIILFMQIVSAQEQYLTPEESEAAVDNELAAMWWGFYPRNRWEINPLNYKYPARGKQTMMVTRLDAGSPSEVHAMIDTSIKVENEGLKGKIVLDSRGIALESRSGKPDGYGIYDQTIRNLAVLVHNHTKLDLLADDRPELIPPGSAKDVAIYCGWYSPGKYVPSVLLAPGAVALHIASFEMTTLHGATAGWCRNLLDAGAVATLGPVAEPYLHAFPAADDFFGVLLTGKLTLAETYWMTNPLISWKITLVGDPLYTPFKNNPALDPKDLPMPLKPIFSTR